jgi:hypothetical protein
MPAGSRSGREPSESEGVRASLPCEQPYDTARETLEFYKVSGKMGELTSRDVVAGCG